MQEEVKDIIKQVVVEFLGKMGFTAQVEIKDAEVVIFGEKGDEGAENIVCDIKIEENPNLLIGQYGINLQSLQHIIRLIVRKKTDDKVRFILDVNSYRQQKNQGIINQAREAAQQAVEEKREIIMPAMSPYERRIVHLELLQNSEVETESVGEGENRKVIVKPVNFI